MDTLKVAEVCPPIYANEKASSFDSLAFNSSNGYAIPASSMVNYDTIMTMMAPAKKLKLR